MQESADRLTTFTYGRDTFEVAIAPTYHFATPTPTKQCDYQSWNGTVRTAARAAGVADGDYTVFVYPAIPCAVHVGSAYADCNGGNTAWINGQFSPETLTHEFVHMVYLLCSHAAGVSCGFADIASDGTGRCQLRERGDRYSTMGGSQGWPTFGELEKLGSVTRAQRVIVQRTALGMQEFELAPLEVATGRLLAVSVTRADGNLYTVERRDAIGLDSFVTSKPSPAYPVRLTRDGYNAYVGDLHAGQRFDDPQGGVSIAITAAGKIQLTVSTAPTPTPGPAPSPTPVRTFAGGSAAPTPCFAGGFLFCTPTPLPQTPTPAPSRTPIPSSPTPTASATAVPAATAPPPTATVPSPTPTPSASSVPTGTATPTSAPSPAPKPDAGSGSSSKAPWYIGAGVLLAAIVAFFMRRTKG